MMEHSNAIRISGLLNRHHRPRKRSYRRRHSGVIVDVLLRNHSFPIRTTTAAPCFEW